MSEKIEKLTDDELIDEYKQYYRCVYETECFSGLDVVYVLVLEAELVRRGFAVKDDEVISPSEDKEVTE